MPGPLAGLKVIEMQGLGPAPLAGQFLADLGAEVTLIARARRKAKPADINNRGKRSLALNLKSDAGREAALKLLAGADVLIEGFRPGVMERIGLGPDAAHDANPRLVYARMTGWGQTGPLAHTAGHDINYLGLTGFLNATGHADRPPTPPINIGADYGGGTMFLLFGIMAALYERQSSGKGQVVDAAMVDGAAAMMALIHGMRAEGLWSNRREANLLDGGAPFYRCYETKDGKFLSVGALEPQFFAELVDKAGLPAAHKASQIDAADWPARREAYAAVFAAKTRAEWEEIFEGADACVAPVLDWDEAAVHPHLSERGVFTEIGGVTQAAPAPRFDRTPADAPRPPGPIGDDAEAILAEAGFDDTAIAELRAGGALL